MPFANNAGVRVNYETEGDGSPLVMLHGRGLCIDDWVECGYTAALGKGHRLILIDARGHGSSDKPHAASAYDTREHASDVVAVLDDLAINKATVFGYSQGARTTLRLAVEYPNRVARFIAGGGRMSAQDTTPIHEVWSRGLDAFMGYLEPAYGDWLTSERRSRMEQVDLAAFVAMVDPNYHEPPILPRLSTLTMPCLLYAGGGDAIKNDVRACADELANAEFFTVPKLGHIETLMRSELVLPRLTRFLGNQL